MTIEILKKEIRILKELYDNATSEWNWDNNEQIRWYEVDVRNGTMSKQALKYLIKWKKLKE